MINFLAANLGLGGRTITTKAGLKDLIKSDPATVKFVPVTVEPMSPGILAQNTTADKLPFGRPVQVTGPVAKRMWTAEVERRFDGRIVVR